MITNNTSAAQLAIPSTGYTFNVNRYYNMNPIALAGLETYPLSDGWDGINFILSRNGSPNTLGSFKIMKD